MARRSLLETSLTDEARSTVLREAEERYRRELMDDEERQLLLDRIKHTGVLQPGYSSEVFLDGEGTVPYHCELHPEMKGTIVVGDGSGVEGTTTENPTDDDPTQNMLQDMLEKML